MSLALNWLIDATAGMKPAVFDFGLWAMHQLLQSPQV